MKISTWRILILVVVLGTVGIFAIFKFTTKDPSPLTKAGSQVDLQTYVALQSLMKQTRYFEQSEVVQDSLRFFDIDNDGDQDVVGFLKQTSNYFSDSDSSYLFSTWHRNGENYTYYSDDHDDFRTSGNELPCSIEGLAIEHVTLTCSKAGHQYPVELYYQKGGVGGYYVDFTARAAVFNESNNWTSYTSNNAGISFRHPKDIVVTEKTYQVFKEQITIVTAKRGEEILFEIHTKTPSFSSNGGGLIDNTSDVVLLRLKDGTYLGRMFSPDVSDRMQKVVSYFRADLYSVNNVGAVFASYDSANVAFGREYDLFSFVYTERELKEIDNIFASIGYLKGIPIPKAEIVPLATSTITFAETISLNVPGRVSDITATVPADNDSKALDRKVYDIHLIDSSLYQPFSLTLELLPFKSIGTLDAIIGGGYDAKTNMCAYSEVNPTPLLTIGEYKGCQFGGGDGGIAVRGYYLLDPYHQYIVKIENFLQVDGIKYLDIDLETIAETARFLKD